MSRYKFRPKISASTYIIFIIFISIYYLIPFIFHLLYPEKFDFFFKLPEEITYLWVVPIVLVMVWALDSFLAKVKANYLIFEFIGKFINNRVFNLMLVVAYLGLSLYFISNFSFNFRHKVRLEEAGKQAMLVFAFNSYFKTFILGKILLFLTGTKLTSKDRMLFFLITTCLVLTATSSYDVIFILIALSITLGLERFLFIGVKNRSFLTFIKGNFKYLLVGTFGFATLFMGVANKYGIDETFELMKSGDFYFLIVRRISMWYVSILSAGHAYFNDISFPIEPNKGLIMDTFRRIGIVLGFSMEKPEIWGINRMNHLIVYRVATTHAGSSPGIFASLFYVPFFPASLFIVSFYIIFVLRQLSGVLENMKENFNIIGFPLMAFFLIPFFESPIEQLNFVGKGFIYFILNVTWLVYVKTMLDRKSKNNLND